MKCPVCENDTFDEEDFEYEICPECFWEYDYVQVREPDFEGGANCHSLNGYRELYWTQKKMKPLFSCRNEEDKKLMIQLDRG